MPRGMTPSIREDWKRRVLRQRIRNAPTENDRIIAETEHSRREFASKKEHALAQEARKKMGNPVDEVKPLPKIEKVPGRLVPSTARKNLEAIANRLTGKASAAPKTMADFKGRRSKNVIVQEGIPGQVEGPRKRRLPNMQKKTAPKPKLDWSPPRPKPRPKKPMS